MLDAINQSRLRVGAERKKYYTFCVTCISQPPFVGLLLNFDFALQIVCVQTVNGSRLLWIAWEFALRITHVWSFFLKIDCSFRIVMVQCTLSWKFEIPIKFFGRPFFHFYFCIRPSVTFTQFFRTFTWNKSKNCLIFHYTVQQLIFFVAHGPQFDRPKIRTNIN